ncbi:hypothetical protein QYF36_016577 [Acer negundo]|nr:hypothetical protein QYF36_016577 [Acer negundo]
MKKMDTTLGLVNNFHAIQTKVIVLYLCCGRRALDGQGFSKSEWNCRPNDGKIIDCEMFGWRENEDWIDDGGESIMKLNLKTVVPQFFF